MTRNIIRSAVLLGLGHLGQAPQLVLSRGKIGKAILRGLLVGTHVPQRSWWAWADPVPAPAGIRGGSLEGPHNGRGTAWASRGSSRWPRPAPPTRT